MKQFLFGIIALTVSSLQLQAQQSNPVFPYDPNTTLRERYLDFTHMRLSVEFVPEKGIVKGKVTHLFTPIRDVVDSFYLDGPDMDIKTALLNGEDVRYKTTADGINFYPAHPLHRDDKDSLTIVYEAHPRKGIYFIGWNDPNNLSRKQIWTQGEGTDNRYWFPCYDLPYDKLVTEVTVKFDKDYQVLSNGVKVEERDNGDGTKTWHYKMSHPHQTYLVMLGIGKYDVKETQSETGVPLHQWYYPEWKDRYAYTYKYDEKVFNFLEREIGVPYPWESYSQIPVQDFLYGAMENTTATVYGDFFEVDGRSYNDRNYVSVNAHELAHQWFGDLVSARTSDNQWLQESFATHYNLLAEKECFGQDHFDWARRQAYLSAINTTDKKPIAHSQAASSIVYQKGSVVLEMLKTVTGHECFRRAVKRYLLAHQYANVDGHDLLNAFQDETGMPLQWFWNEWLYHGGEPDYHVSYEDNTTGDERYTQFIVTQAQPITELIGLFKMPIAFEVHYKDGTTDKKTEWVEKETTIVKVPNRGDKEIAFVLFDPNSEVLKSVTFEKPFEMLKAQALHAPHMLDRYDAVYAMRSTPVGEKRDFLRKVYKANSFHAIKTEIATQFIDDKDGEDLVRMALHNKDVQVRKGVVLATKTIPESLRADYEPLLTDSSYITIATVLEKLCAAFPANTGKYLATTKGIEGTIGRNVLVKWLEIAVAEKGDAGLRDELTALTSGSYEFLTRTNAMAALRRLNYLDATGLVNCINAAISTNGRLAGPATETIKYFFTEDAYKTMVKQAIEKADVSAKEREQLMKIIS